VVAEPPVLFFQSCTVCDQGRVGSLSQNFGGRVHTGGTVSTRCAGILYKGLGRGFSMQEVWICENWADWGVADDVRWIDGCWSDREEMRRGGDVIVNM
jgi:hypothetical protein